MSTETTTAYDAAINDIQSRISALQGVLDSLLQLRAQISGSPIPPPQPVDRSNGSDTTIRHDTFFGMTIGDAANKYLMMVKATRSTGAIADALEQGGLKHSSKDFNTTVRSVLGGRKDFLRVNGDWGLTAWYPAMRNKEDKRGKTSTTPKPAEPTPQSIQPEAQTEQKRKPTRNLKEWAPTGAGVPIVRFLATYPGATHSAKQIAAEIGSDKPDSIASLLSQFANKGRIARGNPFGYLANEETIRAAASLG